MAPLSALLSFDLTLTVGSHVFEPVVEWNAILIYFYIITAFALNKGFPYPLLLRFDLFLYPQTLFVDGIHQLGYKSF